MIPSNLIKYQININDYEIVKEINKGKFIITYEVKNKKTQKQYIAKIISNDKASNMNQKYYHEIEKIMKVINPTVIQYLCFSMTDFSGSQKLTVITDFSETDTLKNLISNLDETKKQIILIGISYGMMKLQQNSINHYDLQLEKIQIDKEFHPQISEFGLLNVFGDFQSNSCEKTIYTAPEITNGNPIDSKIDVYSFGVLMYEIITGNIHDKSTELDFTVSINEFHKKLMMKCISNDPFERPNFEEIFHKLSFNSKYLLEKVDLEQMNSYLEYITMNEDQYSSPKLIISQRNELEKLKTKIKKLNEKHPEDAIESDTEEVGEKEPNIYTIPPPPPPPPPRHLRPYYVEPTPEEKKANMLKKLEELERIFQREEQYWICGKEHCSNYDKPRLDYVDDYLKLQQELRMCYPELTDMLRTRISNLISSLEYESSKNQRVLGQYNYLARGIGSFYSRSSVDSVIQRLKYFL